MPQETSRLRRHFPLHPDTLKRIWGGIVEDDCLDLAAQMSFYFVVSIFPFLLLIAAVMGGLPFTNLWHSFAEWIIDYLPYESRRLLLSTIFDLTKGYKGFLSFGVLGMIWSASSGFVSLMESLSAAYGVKDRRTFLKKRLIAVFATVVAMIFLTASFGLLTLGDWAATQIANPLQSNGWMQIVWEAGRWVITLLLICLGVDFIDYFLPDIKRPWRWLPPSTLVVALLFVGATDGFALYVRHSSSFSKVYGAIAGFIIFLLWIYLASLVVLIGAEADKAMRHPHGSGASV